MCARTVGPAAYLSEGVAFVDSQQRVRCVRAGGVRDQDYAIIEKLLAQ